MTALGDKLPRKIELPGIEEVDRFIAVASGKGGVGKTTVAVNLALALSGRGLNVGLLDADVYGPSIPLMVGLKARPAPGGGEGLLVPPERFGVKIMSVGFLIDEDQPVIWRGPMASKAITELLGKGPLGQARLSRGGPPAGDGRSVNHRRPRAAQSGRPDRHHAAGR
ncbi:MAG: P-loop NTPase, partial [Chromatiaceae bacterium]